MKKNRSFAERVMGAIIDADGHRINQGKYLRMQKRLRAVEDVTYTEWDLRGLSPREKEFVRENQYKCYIDRQQLDGKAPLRYNRSIGAHVVGTSMNRYYIFIARDLATGKKKLYAYSKKQYLNYSGHDICPDYWNYECWLTVDTNRGDINKFNYERRFSHQLAPISIS